jgi:hypothetical protein
MEKLVINSTDKSPRVVFDPENGVFEISGKSVITDVEEFYAPIFDWIETNIPNIPSPIAFSFDLEYFNIASSKRLLFILYKLNEFREELNKDIRINWCFNIEDDDMKEVGEDFACMVNLPFEFISKSFGEPVLSFN